MPLLLMLLLLSLLLLLLHLTPRVSSCRWPSARCWRERKWHSFATHSHRPLLLHWRAVTMTTLMTL